MQCEFEKIGMNNWFPYWNIPMQQGIKPDINVCPKHFKVLIVELNFKAVVFLQLMQIFTLYQERKEGYENQYSQPKKLNIFNI